MPPRAEADPEEKVAAVSLLRRKLFYDYSFIFINVKAALFLSSSLERGRAPSYVERGTP